MVSMGSITLHQLFDWAGAIVLISSLLGTFLPPYEWFDQWPHFQAVYTRLPTAILVPSPKSTVTEVFGIS
jgi:hypothetical protein